jgi:rod shape-determining protein MreD
MGIIIPSVVISFILDSVVSNFNVGLPLFTLMSLIIIYPYFKKDNHNFIRLCGIVGLLYDLVYTDTFLLNFLVFMVIGFIIMYINERIEHNLINVMLTALISIVSYRLITYFILILTGYLNMNISHLISSITSSLIINSIYVTGLYLVTDYYHRKYHILKNN